LPPTHRRADRAALRCEDIDFDTRRMVVHRAVFAGLEGPTKSLQARFLPLADHAAEALEGLQGPLYAALLVSAFAVLFRGAGRSPLRRKPGDTRLQLVSPFRPALAACFAALVLHTFTYADFLEDPETWLLLGIGVALASAAGSAGGRSSR
jgi:hypothetical protein